jgi:hypothetical protein
MLIFLKEFLKMPRFLMKNGEYREVADEEMLSFLIENREQIQDRQSTIKLRPFSIEP